MLKKLGERGLWKLGVYFVYLCTQVLILGALMLITTNMIAHTIMMILAIVLYFAVCLKDPGTYVANPEPNMEDISTGKKSQIQKLKKKAMSDRIVDKEASKFVKKEKSKPKLIECDRKQKKKTSIQEKATILQQIPKIKQESPAKVEEGEKQDKGEERMVMASAKMILGAAKNMIGNFANFMSKKNIEPSVDLDDKPKEEMENGEAKKDTQAVHKQVSLQDQIEPARSQHHSSQQQEEQEQQQQPRVSSHEKVAPQPNKPQTPADLMRQTKRYCRICEFYQPLRVRHCHSCEQCIATFDHHCPWLSTCIGQKNKLLFIFYILTQTLQFLVIFIDLVRYLSNGNHSSTAAVGILLFMVILVLIVLILLLSFHLYLAVNNITTWELFRWEKIEYLAPFDHKQVNSPFSLGWRGNIKILWDISMETSLHNWQQHLPQSLQNYKLPCRLKPDLADAQTSRKLYRSHQAF